MPAVRKALASLKLLEPLPPVVKTAEQLSKAEQLKKAEDTWLDQNAHKVGLPTLTEKAALRRTCEAMQCCVLLAAFAALPDSGLDTAMRLELAQEVLSQLNPIILLLNASFAVHPLLRNVAAGAGVQLQRAAGERMNDVHAIVAAVLASGGQPVLLRVAHPTDQRFQRRCGPCDIFPGRVHHTAVLMGVR